MPEEHVATYVGGEQKEDWEDSAEAMGMSLSYWVQSMVEAGRKKFNRELSPRRSNKELREEVKDLRVKVQEQHAEIGRLLDKAYPSEQEAILDFVEKNQGADYIDIIEHIERTASSRVTNLLTELEGDELVFDEEGRVYTND
ncbi:hypothetical protein SY89_02688 [Halolamina pelagica]|uniref:Uncharacterized protein n=1 Tax=Halolamina pelagica TaxID=699431 RepID=A0A0N8I0C6_9EURY|nr:hypothetical protein [Halolamina pelagica]KPN31931.1 hypothetical protein SY89_02688 [Halolamina pelagica]